MVDPTLLSPSDEAYVAALVASGRYADTAAVWREALHLLAVHERARETREAGQLALLHDVLAHDAAHPPALAPEPEAYDGVVIPMVVDADAVLSEIELLLSTRAPRQYRKAG